MKNVFLSIAFIFVTSVAFTQVKVSPGVRLGLNNATLQGLDNAKSKLGLNAGVFVNFHLSNFYEFQLETNYSKQGASGTANIDNFYYISQNDPYFNKTVKEDFKISYVSLGAINNFHILKDLGVYVLIGPGIDFIVYDGHKNLAIFDISLTGGVGYKLPIGIAIEARYKQGAIDVNDGLTIFGNKKNYYNSVFQLSVSYKFNFSKK